ncbi:VPS10 domain-containing protein [Maricaulis sp. D1M11]|uniref:VPS10 domain-containing protein n=1 Tax=Maricaulis sp. D1M11 TaxID=3076117 RepID=UPI0039B37F3F
MKPILAATVAFSALAFVAPACAQSEDDTLSSGTFSAFELRNIGPAFMSGRISDIDIHPDDPSTWLVSVGSGGVWRTENAGTTWTPLFDGQPVYSIGALTIDPSAPDVIWVGSGENVGGRHVGWGDGIYRSTNGGQTWENMGLPDSAHISQIIVHPDDSDTVWVAAQGPLWSSGGDRGLFKTTDGGETWENVLSDGEWTGVTDVIIDPRNPDRLYAATWQRHRTVAAYMGGGPETAIYTSEDGGESWDKLSVGLPTGNLGKIGLAISPQNPDVIYAAIETERREGGLWRSEDRGQSWSKMSDEVAGGTGPHYYQELYASPHNFDEIYLVSNTSRYSRDGGRTFESIDNTNKHVDDHAIAFREDDPDFILFGSDGGLYESLDGMQTWRYMANLPITQFYKIAVDDSEPFYSVYGGTQDNSTQVGPSRTLNRHGIRNDDWEVVVFADGHQPATEPGNPDIAYGQWQQGNLVRFDRTTGEIVYIQPRPAPGEDPQRYNWDAPILVSSHDPARIYHGSQRLWRSDNRGDSWTQLSGDLTRNQDRMQLPLMGRQWSWEASWDIYAMSNFNTITSIAESPVNEDVLFVGTDDGLIQTTTDGGANWTVTDVSRLPGAPRGAYVNDIKADLFDENTLYVALDNHKYGDFTPYLYMSTDGGRRWTNIGEDLPEDHVVWRIVQDHENPDLLFTGTEFGVFFSVDRGENWIKLTGGAPTIAFRDLQIQRRENDLVAGSFGRGIFVLDDYSPLREVSAEALEADALLFPSRDALWYMEEHPLGFGAGGSQGHGYYRAENPDFGAVFTYYLNDGLQTAAEIRQDAEADRIEAWDDTPFPGFDTVEAERREHAPEVWLVVSDQRGNAVRRIPGATGSGFHRVSWDLRRPLGSAITRAGGEEIPSGVMVAPGTYTATLYQRVRGETTQLAAPVEFDVVPLRSGALEGGTPAEVAAFWDRLNDFQADVSAANAMLSDMDDRLDIMRTALVRAPAAPGELDAQWQALRDEVYAIEEALNGNQSHGGFYGARPDTISSRLSMVGLGVGNSTYGPTPSHLEQFGYAQDEFAEIRTRLNALYETDFPALERALDEAGAPWRRSGGTDRLPN